METKSRYTCGASLIDVGVVCCVVAIGAIMVDGPVKKRSGTEPPFVPPPKRSEGNLVVSMVSHLTELDLNTPGPIRDTYVDTMQLVPVRLPNLATTPIVTGLAAIQHFPVLPTLLVHPVKIEYEQTVCPTSPRTSRLTWSFHGYRTVWKLAQYMFLLKYFVLRDLLLRQDS